VGGPRFDVTRPERPPVVVVEEIGAGGSQSPVDVPEMRTPMIR
jgi:hypothetical protein